jgi:hypothetical protein
MALVEVSVLERHLAVREALDAGARDTNVAPLRRCLTLSND